VRFDLVSATQKLVLAVDLVTIAARWRFSPEAPCC
jgi:hypothetical protein